MEQENTTKLRNLGLNSYETKLWAALLSKGVSTAGELSDISNVPRSRCYDVLESLRKKGFVFIKGGKPSTYICNSPIGAIKNIKEKAKEKAKQEIKNIEDFKSNIIFQELEKIHKQGSNLTEPGEQPCFFKGKNNTKNQLQFMLNNAKKSIHIIETEQGYNTNIIPLTNHLNTHTKNGVEVKIMVDTNTQPKKTTDFEIRKAAIRSRMYVVDQSSALFILFEDSDVSILTNTKTFINHLTNLFNECWNNPHSDN